MDKEIIRLLKSADPQDRIQGIRQLEDSGHPDAVRILAALYKQETDPTVKKFAAKVGRDLKESNAATSALSSAPAQKRDPEQAQKYLERAMDEVINLKNDEAWLWAQKAFRADPMLAEDDYAIGVAAEITGMDQSIAIETLMSERVSEGSEKSKRHAKVGDDDADDVSWGKAMVGVGIYSVLNGVLAFIPILVVGPVFLAIITVAIAQDPTLAAEMSVNPDTSFLIPATIFGVFTFIFSMFGLLLQMAMVHFVATTILGGRGSLTNLLYHVRLPLILQTIFSIVIVVIAAFVLFSDLPTDPAVWERIIITEDASELESSIANFAAVYGLMLFASFASLGFTVWTSLKIGSVYDIGGCKGCLSIIIGSIILGVVGGMVNMLFTALFISF